jgi:predicted dehydrogenase
MFDKVKIIIAGCGGRGCAYADIINSLHDDAEVMAVAEPREHYRNLIGDNHNVPEEKRFRSWVEMAAVPRFADAVIIATPDNMHEAPVVAFAKLGYHIMLEKPMAPTEETCRHIIKAIVESNVMFAVCHVLRYTAFTQKIKDLIRNGAIGDIVSLECLEPVGHWHQAHSFVRGNWRNEMESSFMLLAKSCHDLDWIRYVMDCSCKRVQSFGSLKYFKKVNQPVGAADRCTSCPQVIENNCPYSALKIYIRDRVRKGNIQWPTDVLVPVVTEENVMTALREGPYGRCVFACDNDVVDHQVVNMDFEGDRTASFTMTAFCNEHGRQIRIFGTRGAIKADSRMIWLTDFQTGETIEIDTEVLNDGSLLSGHGGGDGELVRGFIKAIFTGNNSYILSGPNETLESHLMVLGSERSRRNGTVEYIN